jgi:hypothetical protein
LQIRPAASPEPGNNMFYHLFVELSDQISALNVFRYITFRTGGALMTALFLSFMFGPWLISQMRVKQGKGQPIREDGPARHLIEKQGTPTMGGLMILASVLVSTLLWADLSNLYVWTVLFVTMGFGAIGFYDDYLKVTRAKTGGFRPGSGWRSSSSLPALRCGCSPSLATTSFRTRWRCRSSRTCCCSLAGSSSCSARWSWWGRAMPSILRTVSTGWPSCL